MVFLKGNSLNSNIFMQEFYVKIEHCEIILVLFMVNGP